MNAAAVARRVWIVVAALVLSGPAAAGPQSCTIVDGVSVGALRIGMSVPAALAVAGPPLSQQTRGSELIYALREPWAHIVTEYGLVRRISTRSSQCRTARGVGPGVTLATVRQAYADTPISTLTQVPEGDLLSFPFVGTRLLLRRGQVEVVEVMRAETLAQPVPSAEPSPSPVTPGPSPKGPPASPVDRAPWVIRTTSAQATEATLVVAGMVENRTRPASVYAEVRVFNGAGRLIAQGDSPLFPNPVPSGAIASFSVRLTIDDVIRRYVVIIRPIGSISLSLAEQTGEIKDVQQFASLIAKQLQATVQVSANPPTRDDFVVIITNGSQFALANVAVAVEVVATCRLAFPAPRSVQELRVGNVTALQLRPGASARLPLPLSAGVCIEFATWAATPRIGEVRVGD